MRNLGNTIVPGMFIVSSGCVEKKCGDHICLATDIVFTIIADSVIEILRRSNNQNEGKKLKSVLSELN